MEKSMNFDQRQHKKLLKAHPFIIDLNKNLFQVIRKFVLKQM